MTDTFVKALLHQYRDATNLNARARLHESFSTNQYGWHPWVFDQLELPPDGRVLELGCGPGLLWRQNLDRIPHGWEVTLSDFSPGMLEDAQRGLANADRAFRFQRIDAQQIPFADASFDAVIANHMLYHVPNRDQAIGEIRRVLHPEGQFYAATNGKNHLEDAWRFLRQTGFDPLERSFSSYPFSLENGAEQLSRHFSEVDLRRYDDALVVTEVEPVLAYVVSGIVEPEREASELERLAEVLEGEIRDHGAIRIAKESGLFVSRGTR